MQTYYDPWPSVDEAIDTRDAIEKLSAEERFILMYWVAGYTQAEIGALMGLAQNTISERLDSIYTNLRFALT